MAKNITGIVDIPGELHSVATGNIVASANEIYDYDSSSYQSQLNKQLYNVSAHDSSADAKYTLEEAIAAVPTAYQVGGLILTFISKEEDFEIYQLKSKEWSTDTSKWSIVPNNVVQDNPEYVEVHIDGTDKILYGVKNDGDFYFGAGVPSQIRDYVNEKVEKIDASILEIETRFYNVNAHDGSIGINYTLEEAIAAVPEEYRNGGLILTFNSNDDSSTQSSDNKYVQYRLTADEWSTNTEDWVIADEGVYVENPEFVYVKTDKDNKILWAIKTDGGIYYGAGCPQQVKDYIEEKISSLSLDEYEDIVSFLSDYLGSDTTLKTLLDSKLDTEGLDADALGTIEAVENPEYIAAETDAEDKVLGGRKTNGIKFENVGFETPKLDINGNIVENIQDLEGRTEIKTDAEGKILSYRDSDGVIHENAGIKLSKKGYNDFYVKQKEYVDKSVLYFNPKETILPILENFKMLYNVGSTTPNYNNLTLLWFSDIHRDSINLSRIREFYNEYQDYIDDVLSTGDNCRAEPSEDYSWWADNGGSSFLTVLGNHDALAEDNVPKSPKFLYEMFFEPFLSESNIIISENKTYWYKDYSFASSENNPGGIRLISLDCYHWKEPEGTTYDDGSVPDFGEQETWFVNLLNDAKENGMAVIVSLHSPTNEHKALPCTFQVIEDLQIGRTTGYLTDDMLDDVQSFIDAGGLFVTWLTGHAHFDLFCTSERHPNQLILCISTASHTVQWRNVANVKDTKSQDCFNLVSIEPYSGFIRLFRIGTKYDRHGRHIGSALYDYINHRLINSD